MQRMMKIFYSGYSRKEDVPSSSPIEASQDEANNILWNLDFKGCFLGIELKDRWVFQVMNEEDYYYAEFLDRKNMNTFSANLEIYPCILETLVYDLHGYYQY